MKVFFTKFLVLVALVGFIGLSDAPTYIVSDEFKTEETTTTVGTFSDPGGGWGG